MANPASGSTVYVRWYGKTLQGEVVPDDHRVPLFASMVHVRVPIQGTPVIAVFSPSHVYATADTVPGGSPVGSSPKEATIAAVPADSPVGNIPNSSPAEVAPTWSTPDLDAHRARYRQFKADHWDHSRNCLRVDALEEFYCLFRQGVIMRQQVTKAAATSLPSVDAPAEQKRAKATAPVQLTLDFK